MNNKPVYEVRNGLVKATIWEAKGESGAFFNMTVARLYKSDGGWKQSGSFGHGDVPRLHAVLSQAREWIEKREASK